ncbi:MAG: hypothetical protein JNG88_11470 [Phycisphaerales bacterium]|nr:hypothetical protein [Phycisphaerales bacterium]
MRLQPDESACGNRDTAVTLTNRRFRAQRGACGVMSPTRAWTIMLVLAFAVHFHGAAAAQDAGAQPHGQEKPISADTASPVAIGANDATASTPVEDNEISAAPTGLLDVHLRDIDIAIGLQMLSYEARTNIVCGPGVTGKTSANLYNVTLKEALRAILTPGNFAFRTEGRTIFVGTQAEIAAQQPPGETRVFHLNYISPAEAASAIRSLLGETANVVEPGGKAAGAGAAGAEGASSGGGAGGFSGGGGSGGGGKRSGGGSAIGDYVIVSDQQARLTQVEKLLEQLDARPRQVLVEATMLRATLSEDNRHGIDFTLLGGVDFENVSSTSNAGADLTTGALPPDRLQKTTINAGTDFAGVVQGGGFRFGIIHNNLAAFVRALESVTDVTVVANPKVVALNRQEGEVIVGRRDGYLTTTVTQTAAIQSVEFLETGTQIRFRPTIGSDGTVRLEVHPKDSNGGLTAANLPFEETTEAHADVLLRDGHTVLIGGLFRERTVSSSERLPLIGSIPGVGLLFQNNANVSGREEVIILLTVHVLKETDSEMRKNEALLEDIERVRIGARRGVLGTGRDRLAQVFFQEALSRFERNEFDLALLNAEISLHNQPRHRQAMLLRERLIGRRVWDEDGVRMRRFALDLIDSGQRLEGRPVRERFGRPRMPGDSQEDNHQR